MPVTVSLSNPSVTLITVGYSTTPGSAVSPSDLLTSSGTVTIPAGQTTGTFNVTVKGDTVLEDYEYFNVVLSGPGGGASAIPNLGNATEKIQILNNEKPLLAGTAPTESEGKHAPVRCDTRPALLPTDHGHLHDCERHCARTGGLHDDGGIAPSPQGRRGPRRWELRPTSTSSRRGSRTSR